jgi:hypothetical protein
MYKSRFFKWGLKKNLKADQINQARQDARQGTLTVPLIRGRVVGAKTLKRELSRKLPIKYATLARGSQESIAAGAGELTAVPVRAVSPSPMAARVDAPKQFRYAEDCFKAVLEYTRVQFQREAWDRMSDYNLDDYTKTWQNKMIVSYSMVQSGKVKDGFRLIDLCLRNYRAEIANNDPDMIIATYNTILGLYINLPDLANVVLRYIAGFCLASLGPYHPFTRLWSALRSLGLEQLRHLAGAITMAQLNEFETWFRPDAEMLCTRRVDCARQAH